MATLNWWGTKLQLFDNNREPLSGGKIYFYEPGTSTPKDTYSDSGLVTPNANPVVLDAYGRATVYLSGNYKVVVKTSADVTLWTEDNINPDPTAGGDYTNKSGDVKTKSANYDVAAADDGNLIVATSGSWTLGTAVAAATLGNGFEFYVLNAGTGTITFDPNSTETVTYGTATAATTLSIPSNARAHFRCDGSNWYATFESQGTGNSLVLLQSNTISAAANSSFDNLLTSVYNTYILELSGITVATDQEDISLIVGTGATPTYQTSSYQYSNAPMGATTTITTTTHEAGSDNVTSRMIITRKNGNAGAVGNAAGESLSGTVKIFHPSSASIYKHFAWDLTYTDSSGNVAHYNGGGMWKSTTAVTSIRVLTGTTGNMSGTASLYAVRM